MQILLATFYHFAIFQEGVFLGVTFPNQTRFGLEKDTEWNVAALQMDAWQKSA